MKLHFVDTMDEVLALALERPLPAPLLDETTTLAPVPGEVTGNLPAPQ
jgi:ATP-dependent Lon protease